MKDHLSADELDAILEGGIPHKNKDMAQTHLASCGECRMRLDVLRLTGKYLETVEKVDDMFTERVMETLSKKRYTGNRKVRSRRKAGIGKPIFAFLMVCVLVGVAFYFGTKFDSMRNKAIGQTKAGQTEAAITPAATAAEKISEAPAKDEVVTLTLYFPNLNYDAVVPHERKAEVKKGEILEKVIFEELQKGPDSTGTGSIIPDGTRLLSVETKDGICYLNLSPEFVDNNPGGTAFEGVLINSIVNSLTELPQIKKVQFLINGEKREVYTHVVFDEPFERNESFIRTPDNTSEAIEAKVRELGEKTLNALKNRDMLSLSAIVHPDKKVRFSPYTFVDTEKDLTFSAEEIKGLLENEKVYTWGSYDGSGDPINLTFSEYLSRFVYDRDFIKAEEIVYNRYISRGNTINNIFEAYPEGKVIEYHFPGFDPKYEGIDWESLKLVFEEKDGKWYLTGIVHDQWTI